MKEVEEKTNSPFKGIKMSKAEMTRLRVAKHRAKSVILTEEQQKAKRENQRKRTAECRRKKAQDQLDVER